MKNIIERVIDSAKETLKNTEIVKVHMELTGKEAEEFNCSMPPKGFVDGNFHLIWALDPEGKVLITCYLQSTLDRVYG